MTHLQKVPVLLFLLGFFCPGAAPAKEKRLSNTNLPGLGLPVVARLTSAAPAALSTHEG